MISSLELVPPRRLAPAAAVAGTNLAVVLAVVSGHAVAFLGLLSVGAVGLWIVTRPQRGLLLLVALVPFDGLLLLVPHPGAVDGWKEGLTILTLAATFVAPAGARARTGAGRPAWIDPLVGLFAVSLASAAMFPRLSALLGLKIGFFYVLTAWALWRCPLGPRERDRLVTILLAGGIVTAAYGVAQQVIGAAGLVRLGYEYNTTVRFAGSFLRSFSTFVQPFGFGFYLMAVVLIALPGALREPQRLRSRVLLWSLPLLTAGILSTLVRGAWLGLAVGVVYLGVARHRSLLLLLPLALAAVLLLPSEAATSALSSSSASERTTGWSQNLHQVVRHPVGVGVGSSGASAEKAAELAAVAGPVYQPDNQYFLTLYELGPLGLWMLVLVFAAVYRTGRTAARSHAGRDADLALGFSALVVAALAASTVASFLQIFPMDVLWWVLLAAVTVIPVSSDASTPVLP